MHFLYLRFSSLLMQIPRNCISMYQKKQNCISSRRPNRKWKEIFEDYEENRVGFEEEPLGETLLPFYLESFKSIRDMAQCNTHCHYQNGIANLYHKTAEFKIINISRGNSIKPFQGKPTKSILSVAHLVALNQHTRTCQFSK